MPHRESTIRSRELGGGLREALKQAGLNGKQAAQVLEVTPGYVSMLLSGKRGASEVDIAAFLGACGVRGPNGAGCWHCAGIRTPRAGVVPGLLQTGEYARSVISRIVNVPPDEIDDRVAARLARQNLFSRERPARFTFYLHESVLRTPVGGPAVMAQQHGVHRVHTGGLSGK